jgi:hypothetical protein
LSGNATSATTATNLSTTRTNWSTNGTITAVVGQLAWKNYGNSHTIFDASASTAPDGTSVNNTNSQVAWSGTYPTLMGWNGANTYGVRVDSARNSDTTAGLTPSVTSGAASRIVVADGSGYIFNNYFNSTDNAITSGVTAIMSKQGNDYYRSASAAAVAAFVATQNLGIGASQTWTNVAGSRAYGTTYTNSTGRSIVITVTATGAANNNVAIYISGTQINAGGSGGGAIVYDSVSAVVPNGVTYRAQGTGAIAFWWELR